MENMIPRPNPRKPTSSVMKINDGNASCSRRQRIGCENAGTIPPTVLVSFWCVDSSWACFGIACHVRDWTGCTCVIRCLPDLRGQPLAGLHSTSVKLAKHMAVTTSRMKPLLLKYTGSIMLPLAKGSGSTDRNDYRPITLTCCLRAGRHRSAAGATPPAGGAAGMISRMFF